MMTNLFSVFDPSTGILSLNWVSTLIGLIIIPMPLWILGMMSFMPSMSLFWFMFCSSNMASPPSMNLLGEIMIINSLISWSSFSVLFLGLMSFLSACYSLYLFSYSQHGNFYSGYYSFSCGYVREYLLLILHGIFLAMHYSSNVEMAFNSISHICRDVNFGWLIQ